MHVAAVSGRSSRRRLSSANVLAPASSSPASLPHRTDPPERHWRWVGDTPSSQRPIGDMPPTSSAGTATRWSSGLPASWRTPSGIPCSRAWRRATSPNALPDAGARSGRAVRSHHGRLRPRPDAGHDALEPPGIHGVLLDHGQRARRARRLRRLRAEPAGHALAHVAVRDRARGGGAGLAAAAHRPAGHVRGRHLRHGVDLQPARPRRGARGGRARRAHAGPRRAAPTSRALRVYCSDQAHSSIEKGVILPASATRRCARSRPTPSTGCDPTPLRAAIAEDRAAGVLSHRRRRHRRHHLDHERRSGGRDCGRLRGRRGSGCTSTRPTPAWRPCCPSTRTSSPAPSARTRSS